MFANLFWTLQHIPLRLRTCASPNRATSSMGGSSWCRSPHKPSHTSRTKQHNRSYSCHGCMNMRHKGFYLCTVDTYCRIAPSPCSWNYWQGWLCVHTLWYSWCVWPMSSAVDTTDYHCWCAVFMLSLHLATCNVVATTEGIPQLNPTCTALAVHVDMVGFCSSVEWLDWVILVDMWNVCRNG